jgi:two-component system, OmpR family, KDP operon response regulator KdpE
VFISQLRRKIETDPTRPRIIATDPGVGYRWMLKPADEAQPAAN